MANISIEDLEGKADSLYRLVLAAAKRASQLARPDARPLVQSFSRKPTVVAIEEIIAGKVQVVTEETLDEETLPE